MIDRSELQTRFLKLSTSIRNLLREITEPVFADADVDVVGDDDAEEDDGDVADAAGFIIDGVEMAAPSLLVNETFLMVGDDDVDELLS